MNEEEIINNAKLLYKLAKDEVRWLDIDKILDPRVHILTKKIEESEVILQGEVLYKRKAGKTEEELISIAVAKAKKKLKNNVKKTIKRLGDKVQGTFLISEVFISDKLSNRLSNGQGYPENQSHLYGYLQIFGLVNIIIWLTPIIRGNKITLGDTKEIEEKNEGDFEYLD